jgi:hypothetical protein
MSDYTSAIQFPISGEKTIAIERLQNTISIIKFGIQDGFEGFSKEQGENKSLEELCTRLLNLLEKIKSNDVPEDLMEHNFFTEITDETIDLESNEIEFEESICTDGYSIIVYCSFHCRSKFVEGIVKRANESVGNKMDVSNISINDYDEHYIEMAWF